MRGILAPLRLALGDLPIYTSCYSASEAIIGLNLEIDRPERYVLTPGQPTSSSSRWARQPARQPETVGVEALSRSARTEVVLTNRGGLCRYRLRDVVRVEGWHERARAVVRLAAGGTVLDLVGRALHRKACWRRSSRPVRAWSVAPMPRRLHGARGTARAAPPATSFMSSSRARSMRGARARGRARARRAKPLRRLSPRRSHRPPAVRPQLPAGSFRASRGGAARANGVSAVQLKTGAPGPRRRNAALARRAGQLLHGARRDRP
ncbi:GH3 auxin-responsive promoter family protein [Nannocystis sp.]|uniref:GH3 family domain-containing protein n=1 Tax=Nannocystis sp. TaxID=1962667 RepID=UPI00344CCFB7|nr:GH3 auxin-responsive promoter family protein [Nannocystis sp.]